MKEEADTDSDEERDGERVAQQGTSHQPRSNLTLLNASQASAQRYPPGCPVVYGLRHSSTSKRLDAYQATVKHIFIDVVSRNFFYEVVKRTDYYELGSKSALDLEQQVGKLVNEDELAYAINCPVKVKGLIDNDPDKRLAGRIVCPGKAKNDLGMTYTVQFLIGKTGFLRVQQHVPWADIDYDTGEAPQSPNKEVEPKPTRGAASNGVEVSSGRKALPKMINKPSAESAPSVESASPAQGVTNSTGASSNKFDTIKSRKRKGTSDDDTTPRGETNKNKKRKGAEEIGADGVTQKVPRRRGSRNHKDSPSAAGGEKSSDNATRNIDTNPIPLSVLTPGVKVIIASGKMSDKDWLFYATIVSVKEPTKSNKRKNLQIKVCYEGYRGPYANATVKHKSIIHVLPPHKDITELERPQFALSYQAENIAPFKRAGDDKSNDHGILGPVHCTFTMWGRRNALVEWEGLTSPMDFTVAEIEKETQSGVIKLKYGTNTI